MKKHYYLLSVLITFLILIAPSSASVIGIRWNQSSSSPSAITYIDTNGVATTAPNFSQTLPWSGMRRLNISSTQYQTMTTVPKFWYNASNYTVGSLHYYEWFVSDQPAAGYVLHPSFIANGVTEPSFLIGSFEGSNYNATTGYNRGDFSGVSVPTDKLSSVVGSKPISGANNSLIMSDFRTLAENRGAGWEMQTFNQISAIELLYLMEYGSFNSQSVLSAGVTQITDDGSTNMAVNTGYTAGVGTNASNYYNGSGQAVITHYKTGQTTYPFSYRGIENIYGNIWKWVDGINIKADRNPWIANHGFASDTFASPYVNTGLTLGAMDGYVIDISSGPGLNYGFLSSGVGGSASTYLCDYYYQAPGNKAALFGGSWNFASLAGAFNWALNNVASNVHSSFGARLSYTPNGSDLTNSYFMFSPVAANFTASNTTGLSPLIVTFTDTSTGTPLYWNWSFGDGVYSGSQNPTHVFSSVGNFSVTLTSSNDYTVSTSPITYINVTAPSGGFTEADLTMERQYTLQVTFLDSSNNNPVPVVYVADNFGNNETTTNGIYTHTYAYSTVILYITSMGYLGKSVSYVMDSDKSEIVLLTPSTSTQQSLNVWWTPHTVQITLMDSIYQNRLVDVEVTANYNHSSIPTEWLSQLYGIQNLTAQQMINSSLALQGRTGSDGTLTTTMLGSLYYDIKLNSAKYGLTNYMIQAYPSDSMLNIYVPVAGMSLPISNTNQTLRTMVSNVTEPNLSYVTMWNYYQDPTGLTTEIDMVWRFANNNSVIKWQNTSSPGTSLVTGSLTMKNIRNTQVWWGMNATLSAN